MQRNNQLKYTNNAGMGDALNRKYVWTLFNMLPSFAYFELEILEGDEVIDGIRFSRNTDDEAGKERLYEILGKYPDPFGKIKAEFSYGFGFDLKVKVWL